MLKAIFIYLFISNLIRSHLAFHNIKTSSQITFKSTTMQSSTNEKDILYDMPISNHGARVRMIISAKNIGNFIDIKQPSEIGGMKSVDYLKLNAQGKIPLYVCKDTNYPIPESDCIAKYLLDKYIDYQPTFIPKHIMQRSLSEQICRFEDLYIAPLQGTMYKAPGTMFSIYGTNRQAGLNELKKQLLEIENLLNTFESSYPTLTGNYLCGNEISLADVSLYPTIVFCVFMLPQFFQWEINDFLGPKLYKWYNFMSNEVNIAINIKNEMIIPLNSWKDNGRFLPIIEEMKTYL